MIYNLEHVRDAKPKWIMDKETQAILQTQSTDKPRLKLVACIPCFNTGPYIRDIVERARGQVEEVIVINDGSQDYTAVSARQAGAVVIDHHTNRGYGEAIKTCFAAAKASGADVLVILDGDKQHNPDEIPNLLAPVLRGEADLVIGSRFLGDERNMPRYRKFGISVITSLWNLGSRVTVSDSQSGFRAYSSKVFQSSSLRETGMGISIEILEKARRRGDTIKEVPVSCLYVASTLNTRAIKHGLSVALAVIRIRLRHFLKV